MNQRNAGYKEYDALSERIETLLLGEQYVCLMAISLVDEKYVNWCVQDCKLENWCTIEDVRFSKVEIDRMSYRYFDTYSDAFRYYLELIAKQDLKHHV